VSCAAAAVVLDTVASPEFRRRADALGRTLRERLEEIAAAVPAVVEVRGLGAMLAIELPPELVPPTIAAARERGLLLLSCGLHGEAIRLLPPVTIGDEELTRGLDALEAAVREAAGA
jgi:4-aminobutyrate aminotransferase/(S)-3-amino-2-methylpropionate transaminase